MSTDTYASSPDALLATATDTARDTILRGRYGGNAWQPYPWQVCPGTVVSQGLWLINGGRGIGKTDGCTHYVLDHVAGAACDPRLPGGHRIAIIAPTLGDGVESCVTGPSGLQTYNPDVKLRTAAGGTFARFPGGATARLFGASTPEDVERLRAGGNRCLVWAEEIAAWRYLDPCWKHARYGLRIGTRPHFVGSSTPKPRPEYKKLLTDRRTLVTRGRTTDAIHLDATVREALLEDYAGTRLGRQELDGEMLDDVVGALWSYALLDADRVADHPDLSRLVIPFDPAVTSGEDADEHGIVAVGLGVDGDIYVLGDHSLRGTPHQAITTVARVFDDYEADFVVGEVNNGGEWIGTTLHLIRADVPYMSVRASRGKAIRAQPVATLYERHRVHHVGTLPKLEDQMTSWVPGEGDSPDRVDALVWGVTALTSAGRGRKMGHAGWAA